jgi:hypothetical protein
VNLAHPLLQMIAVLPRLTLRGRGVLRDLLDEIAVDDDDASTPCRAEASAEASAAAAAEAPSVITQVDSGQRRAPGRPRAPAEAKPATKASAAPEPGDWLKLRGEIRAAIRDRGLTRREAAVEGNFNIGSFARWLSRTARPPGRATQEQLRAWLDKGMPTQHPPKGASTIADTPLPETIPVAPAANPVNGEDHNRVAPPTSEPRLSRLDGAPLPPYKLTDQQQSRLALVLQHDPGALRGVATREVAEKAAAGQPLAPAIIARLIEVVDQPQTSNGAAG